MEEDANGADRSGGSPSLWERRLTQLTGGRVDLSPRRLLATLVLHEVLGAGILAGAWAACYRLGLTSRLLVPLLPASARAAHGRGEAAAKRAVARWPRLARRVGDPQRLVVSAAESFLLRKLAGPVLVPVKLLAAFYLAGTLC